MKSAETVFWQETPRVQGQGTQMDSRKYGILPISVNIFTEYFQIISHLTCFTLLDRCNETKGHIEIIS